MTRVFCDPGDVVICEAPSYVGALGVFKAYQCDVVHAEMDADGLVPEALRQAIAATRAAGKKIKFLYTIPNFHNPAGVTLVGRAPRRDPGDLPREDDLLILEDNPYGLLGFDGEPMRALRADEAEGVIYLGSFSKTFAPGFRVGWALAPHTVREKLVLAQESATLCPPQFSQMAVSAYLVRARLAGPDQAVPRDVPRAPRRDGRRAARPDARGCRWNVPDGGLLRLADPAAGHRREGDAAARGDRPRRLRARARRSSPTGSARSAMRLSYCYPTPERIREGVRRLAGVIEAELELRATFDAYAPARELGPRGYDGPTQRPQLTSRADCPVRDLTYPPIIVAAKTGFRLLGQKIRSPAPTTSPAPAASCWRSTTSATSTSSTAAWPRTRPAARCGSWRSGSCSTTGGPVR